MVTPGIADAVGRVLGDRYRLLRLVGVGASAYVYAAEDVQLGRRVAVKMLNPGLASDQAFLRRFHHEGRAIASLRHPAILRVYHSDVEAETPYLVTELLEGGSLRSLLDRGIRLSPEQAAAVGSDAARALDYAHRRGLVHRDIKPANLIFDDEGKVSVADFGLARALAESSLTEPDGAVVGTARYAPPELGTGRPLDHKADVYALALVLIEAVTGEVPLSADTSMGTVLARAAQPLPVPARMGPLGPVLSAAGDPDPSRRPDAAALARGLDSAAARLPLPARLPVGDPELRPVESDLVSPTEYPGRPRLFDQVEVESLPAGRRPGTAVPEIDLRGSEPSGGALHAGSRAASADPAPVDERRTPAGFRGPDDPRPHPRRRRRLALAVLVLLVIAGAIAGGAWYGINRLKPEHPIPVLIGQDQAAAVATLAPEHLHLAVSGLSYSARFPSGEVISQSPANGHLREGGTVRVVLSEGPQPVAVPALAGKPAAVATSLLGYLGLKSIEQPHSSMTVPAGDVISASPSSGTLLPGQAVTLEVSTGKPQVPVPPVAKGETGAQAEQALASAGLVAVASQAYNNTVPAGQIVSLSPAPGTPVPVGSTVGVVISKGPQYVTVRDVANLSVGAATEDLQAQGLTVSGVRGDPLGTVVSTDPRAGSQVIEGASVTLVTG